VHSPFESKGVIMDRIRAQAVERLLDSIATSFPSRPTPGEALVGQCWLPLLSGGGAYPGRAEPFVADQSQSEAAANIRKFVAEACAVFGVPILWINAVMMQESGGDVRARLTGGDGPYADHA
jgi:hypothetical protein